MRRSNATTLHDVAQEAGVTAMTVSVVLNGARSATRVSDATRARIQEAALRLNYRRNAVARGLSRRRMDTIGVVAVIDGGEVNHYFLEVLNGILEGAKDFDQNTTVFSVNGWNDDQQRILNFCDGRVDGIILIAPLLHADFADRLAHVTPMVSLHPNETFKDSVSITSDEESGVWLTTRYLIELGHRNIVHIAAPSHLLGGRLRYMGFRRAMQEAGLPVGDESVIEAGFNIESGRQRAEELFASGRPFPTAIVCASDAIAYGVAEVIAARGLRIPDDISLVGFDDTILASIMQPQLTTVRQPFRRMGHRAVELMLEQVRQDQQLVADEGVRPNAPAPGLVESRPGSGHDLHRAKVEVFDVELKVRGSVGPPRSSA